MATVYNNRSTLLTDPLRNFRFLVTFHPQDVTIGGNTKAGQGWATNLNSVTMGFTSVSGLATSVEAIPYREGGYNTTVHQLPGQTSFAPLNLQRGVMLGNRQAWDWMRELFRTVQSNTARQALDNFRCDIEIQVLSHPMASVQTNQSGATTDGVQDDHVAMRIKVYNAWITSLAYSDLSAGDNAILVEAMSLVHEGFDISWGTDLTAAGSAPVFTN